MAKELKYGALLGIYGALLTQKQYEVLACYYDDDFSLGEIAENMCISRQGVRDFIKRGEALLDEYDDKLHLTARLEALDVIRQNALLLRERDADAADAILNAADYIENGSCDNGI